MMIMVFWAFFHSTGWKAVGECLAEQEDAHVLRGEAAQGHDIGDMVKLAGQRLEDADTDEKKHRPDEDVRRAGEESAALSQPAKVDDHHQEDRERDQRNRDGLEGREGRIQRLDARGHANRHGQDIVREQRPGGDEPRDNSQIGMRDDVAAAAAGICPDGLAIAERDNDEQCHNNDGESQDVFVVLRSRARQDEHHGPGRVRN
jgi:hypothetical protein